MAKIQYDKVRRNGYDYFRWRHWDPVEGKYDKTIYATSYKILKSKVEDYESVINAGVVDVKTAFGDYISTWLKEVCYTDLRPTTIERYDCVYRNHITPSRIAKMGLLDLSTRDLQVWYNDVFESKGYNTVKSIDKLVRPCIRYAYDNGHILKNWTGTLKIPKPIVSGDEDEKINPLTKDEQFKVIKAWQGHPLEPLFDTAIDTGMRQGEMLALTWKDIDFERERIKINRTISWPKDMKTGKHYLHLGLPKNGKKRTIRMPKRIKEVLRRHLIRQKETFMRLGIKHTDKTVVFSNDIGGYLERNNVRKRLVKVYAECGITDHSFHDLRHTYATRAFELGVPAKVVQKNLGHSNVAITLNTYTTVLEEMEDIAASKIDELYENPISPEIPTGQISDKFLRLVK